MSHAHPLGQWTELVIRLDRAGCPSRWAADPVLSQLRSVDELLEWTAPGNPKRADEVLGAIVRQAAMTGAGDEDATLVLLHLLLPGVRRIARRLAHLSVDPLTLVLGELTIQIRRFPVGRRVRAYAANLLRDTQLAIWRGELKPYRTDRPRTPDLLIDPVEGSAHYAALRPGVGPEYDDVDLVDLLLWARRTQAVNAVDLAVLIELEYAAEIVGAEVQKHVARHFGCTVRTVQRRRDRALAALRACSAAYLAAA